MQHHYLVTEDVPEVAAIDGRCPPLPTSKASPTCSASATASCSGCTRPTPSTGTDGPGWDYGMELIAEEVDRIAPELSIGFERFPRFIG